MAAIKRLEQEKRRTNKNANEQQQPTVNQLPKYITCPELKIDIAKITHVSCVWDRERAGGREETKAKQSKHLYKFLVKTKKSVYIQFKLNIPSAMSYRNRI